MSGLVHGIKAHHMQYLASAARIGSREMLGERREEIHEGERVWLLCRFAFGHSVFAGPGRNAYAREIKLGR